MIDLQNPYILLGIKMKINCLTCLMVSLYKDATNAKKINAHFTFYTHLILNTML